MKNDKKILAIDYSSWLSHWRDYAYQFYMVFECCQASEMSKKLDTKTVSIFCVFWYLKYSFIISG